MPTIIFREYDGTEHRHDQELYECEPAPVTRPHGLSTLYVTVSATALDIMEAWPSDAGNRPGPKVTMSRVVVCGVVAVTVQETTIGPIVSPPGPIKSYGVARMRSITL